jgi:hypothetical protein
MAVKHVAVSEAVDPDKAHAIIILEAETGRRVGHSPNYVVEQTKYTKDKNGTITTTLKITHVKDAQ